MNDKSVAALARLQELNQRLETEPDISFSAEQIEAHFKDIALAAYTFEGYKNLCWDVGTLLLIVAEDEHINSLGHYRYLAIQTALSCAIAQENLPDGLGWSTSAFMPNDRGNTMLSILSHPMIQDELTKSLCSYSFSLDLSRIDPSNEKISQVTTQFLANLHRFGLKPPIQLMWAAKLFQHLHPENPTRKTLIRIILEGLVRTGRYINAFYWLQAHFSELDEQPEDIIFNVISEIITLCLNKPETGYQILTRMSADDDLSLFIFESQRTQLLSGFIMLWLLIENGVPVKQSFIDQTLAVLWQDHPNIRLFVQIILGWAVEIIRQTGGLDKPHNPKEYFEACNRQATNIWELEQEFTLIPNYRGRQLAVDVWKECRDETFIPLLSRLKIAGNKELAAVKRDINVLDSEQLIKNSKSYRTGHHARAIISGDTKAMLETDFQNYIGRLGLTVDLCHQTIIVRQLVGCIEDNRLNWDDINQEYEDLLAKWPSLEEYLQNYFWPILNQCVITYQEIKDGSGS